MKKLKNIPPFQITSYILTKSQEISRELGILSGSQLRVIPVQLRRENRIKTIQSSLAIEGNTLTLDQVFSLVDGKKVVGPHKDILEVQNALIVYNQLSKWDALLVTDLKKAHTLLMNDLVDQAGFFRTKGVGVFKGTHVAHIAPPAQLVPDLMEKLFNFITTSTDIPWIIKASVFHYELEFIHPFIDGNGRMGRLWQQLLLMKEDPIFEFICVESIIKENQSRYYEILGACDQAGESTLFIEFSLEIILIALRRYTQSVLSGVIDFKSRLTYTQQQVGNNWFSRKEYLAFHKEISSATASRDLLKGVQDGILKKQGNKNQVTYQFILSY